MKIWENFDDFYAKVQASAAIAFDAGQAANIDTFREQAKKLRVACDGCHAQYMHVEQRLRLDGRPFLMEESK